MEFASKQTKPASAGLIGSQAHAWESISRGSASIVPNEVEPLNLRYQAGAW